MKRLLFSFSIIVALIAHCGYVNGQEEKEVTEKLKLSANVASGFVWRGQSLNSTPVIQPSFTFALGRFSIGSWTSTSFVPNEYKEIDLFASFLITPNLSIGITDYYSYDNWSSPNYFSLKNDTTAHAFDLQLNYNGLGIFPVRAMVSTIIAGADLNNKGKNNFSTYFELGYGNNFSGVNWDFSVGFVPMSSAFYNLEDFNVVNVSLSLSKSFTITPTYSLPLSLTFTVNPAEKAAFLTAAITLF